jgi:hypothetical protein
MSGLTQTQIMRHVMETLITVTSKATSQNYALMLLRGFIESMQNEYPMFNHISFAVPQDPYNKPNISIDDKLDTYNKEDFAAALNALIRSVFAPLSVVKGEYTTLFKGYLGAKYCETLDQLGVAI